MERSLLFVVIQIVRSYHRINDIEVTVLLVSFFKYFLKSDEKKLFNSIVLLVPVNRVIL